MAMEQEQGARLRISDANGKKPLRKTIYRLRRLCRKSL